MSRLPLRYVGRPGLLAARRPQRHPRRALRVTQAAKGKGSLRATPRRWLHQRRANRNSGARRLAPELRQFVSRGCNRGVVGVLRVPAQRSRVSARNGIKCAVARCNVSASRSNALSGSARFVLSACVPGKVSVHAAGRFAAEVWQRLVRVVAEAWPCWCPSVPGLLLEWDDLQRRARWENSGARVAIERHWPGQLASAL